MAKFGVLAGLPIAALTKLLFSHDSTRALLAGVAAHSCLPLESLGTASFGLVLTLAGHNVGWPIPKGGAGSISGALGGYLKSLGGEIVTDCPVRTLSEIPRCTAVFFDLTPRQIISIAGNALSKSYLDKLRKYQYGPGVFKMDWALSAPIPWKDPSLASAATVHLAGSLDELRRSEREVWRGGVTERPFVLLSQPSLFDQTRAPFGKETAWAYCHVPNGSLINMSARIEAQIERFAPGFRNLILAKSALNPSDLERRNPNLIGGDLNGGAVSMNQLLFRPTSRLYSTSSRQLYICSSSTPPGGGVHGLCGYYAAKEALSKILK
jgi:phytoene dehydrogenase-like protein